MFCTNLLSRKKTSRSWNQGKCYPCPHSFPCWEAFGSMSSCFSAERGVEGQRSLTKSSFKFETNAAVRNYPTMSHDELSKNHPGGLKDGESTENEARHNVWDRRPKWRLQGPQIVSPEGKSKVYFVSPASKEKCHGSRCRLVRATNNTLWSNAGISSRHISFSGHHSEKSLVSYNPRPSTSQLYNCCQVLSRAFSPSANNHSEPSETSQQSESFHTKQTATESTFGECTFQNV